MDYFEVAKHTVKYDHSIWELDVILANLYEGFTVIKCNNWEENSTWIMSNYKLNELILNIIFKNYTCLKVNNKRFI